MSAATSDHHESLIARARRRLAVGDALGAEKLAAEVLACQPHCRPALLIRARAQVRLGHAEQALHTLDTVAWYSPDGAGRLATVRIVRSSALAQLGRTDQAIAELRAVVKNEPDHRGARIRLGALLLDTAQSDEAIVSLAPARDPRRLDRTVDRLLAEAAERTGDYERALTLRRRLYRAGDRGMASVLRIARLCASAGRTREALEVYDALYRRSKMNAAIAHEAADMALAGGDTVRGLRWLAAAIADDPGDLIAMRRMAKVHLSCGRFAEAGRMFWRLSRRDDDDGSGLAGLIVTALCAGRNSMADRFMKRYASAFDAATRREQMTQLWLTATPGRLVHGRGVADGLDDSHDVFAVLVSDAQRTIERELSRHPDYADLHFHRAACRAALGDGSGEAESLDAALAINAGYLAAGRRRIAHYLADGDTEAAREVLAGLSTRHDPAELAPVERRIVAGESRAA